MPDTTEPEETPTELPEGEPIDDAGNAYTRDLLYDKATNKQFITIQTKNGNTFYIIIDYDAPINDEEEQYQTYFLNMVDEADLLALMDEEADHLRLRNAL
jgi:sugar/nucleoside kinase (ribokinase family)